MPNIRSFESKIIELKIPATKFKNSRMMFKFYPKEIFDYLLSRRWVENGSTGDIEKEGESEPDSYFEFQN